MKLLIKVGIALIFLVEGDSSIGQTQDERAHEVLRTNVDLFPLSWNSYDSYGEILLKMGKKEEAIGMYRKSIELNSKNEGGKKVLDEILGKK